MSASVTNYSAAFRECLERLDVALMRKLWRHIQPNQDQPKDDADTLVAIHMARTECKVLPAKLRMYSHCWLTERSYPSMLPDHMRASAERLFPMPSRAVGISYNTRSPLLRPVVEPVRSAMETAVLESFADNDSDAMVTRHMNEARDRELGKLLGLKRA